MLKLMNSAMMPVPGVYRIQKISPEQAREIVKKHHNIFESYVGYQDTAAYMSQVLGVDVPVNRAETVLADEDEILVCKLKYRVAKPSDKGKFTPSDEDYEWFWVKYRRV